MFPPHVSADDTRSTVAAYFGETYRHDDGTTHLTGLLPARYRVEWFDPREGRFTGERIETPHDGSLTVLKPPSTDADWMLLVRKA